VPLTNQVFAATHTRVAIPYVVTFLPADVVLPAKNNDTPVFGVMVTFALEEVLDMISIVAPIGNATFEVVGI
jgi:hypothetical protein